MEPGVPQTRQGPPCTSSGDNMSWRTRRRCAIFKSTSSQAMRVQKIRAFNMSQTEILKLMLSLTSTTSKVTWALLHLEGMDILDIRAHLWRVSFTNKGKSPQTETQSWLITSTPRETGDFGKPPNGCLGGICFLWLLGRYGDCITMWGALATCSTKVGVFSTGLY